MSFESEDTVYLESLPKNEDVAISGGGGFYPFFSGDFSKPDVFKLTEAGDYIIPHSRFVKNYFSYSSDLSRSVWNKTGKTKIVGTDQIKFVYDEDKIYQNISFDAYTELVFQFKFAADDNDKTLKFWLSNDEDETVSRMINIKGGEMMTWAVTLTHNVTKVGIKNSVNGVGQTLTLSGGIQVEDVTGLSNKNPSEYIETDSTPKSNCFSYTNPYYVVSEVKIKNNSLIVDIFPKIKR